MIARTLATALVALILGGCNPFSEAGSMMDEYVERVGRVLEMDPVMSGIPPGDILPPRRDRVLTMPDLDMGMLDFLSLYGCQLQYVVGERNSVMGRVMTPLNRLRYELRFIAAAGECIPEVESPELRATLVSAITSKKLSLPIAVWNATWATEEVESLVTLAKGSLPLAPDPSVMTDLEVDLSRLNAAVAQLLEGRSGDGLDDIGLIHQRWQAGHQAGQAMNSALLLAVRLQDATRLITRRLNERPLCINRKPNNQSAIVQSMFFSVYVGRVQPYLAEVRRVRDGLIVPLDLLASRQDEVMPLAFQPWRRRMLSIEAEESIWRELDQATAEHVKAWQHLLGQCGLRPGDGAQAQQVRAGSAVRG